MRTSLFQPVTYIFPILQDDSVLGLNWNDDQHLEQSSPDVGGHVGENLDREREVGAEVKNINERKDLQEYTEEYPSPCLQRKKKINLNQPQGMQTVQLFLTSSTAVAQLPTTQPPIPMLSSAFS